MFGNNLYVGGGLESVEVVARGGIAAAYLLDGTLPTWNSRAGAAHVRAVSMKAAA
jgi:hypothetical protein